jgi:hypothetical protein
MIAPEAKPWIRRLTKPRNIALSQMEEAQRIRLQVANQAILSVAAVRFPRTDACCLHAGAYRLQEGGE